MKPFNYLLTLVLSLSFSLTAFAQSTPGILRGKPIASSETSSDLFGNKKRQEARERNEELEAKNDRLRDQIRRLEVSLDRCAGSSAAPQRFPRRKATYGSQAADKFIGGRQLDREYDRLKDENRFLVDERNWLMNELSACRDRNQRDKYGDRDERGRSNDCCCDSGKGKKGKGKGKKKKRYDD